MHYDCKRFIRQLDERERVTEALVLCKHTISCKAPEVAKFRDSPPGRD